MIYLDNAATSYPKPKCVINALIRSVRDAPGNPGRSSHKFSVAAAEAIYSTRESVADFLNCKSAEGVVFTYNATYALNMAIKTYIEDGSHVITSDIEHNSVIRPLEKLVAERNVSYSIFSTDNDLEKEIEALIRKDTKAIISTIASNVTGERISLELLSRISKKYGLILIVDASQAIGHYRLDLEKTPCDVLCAPAHKALFGIQGAGFAVFSDAERRKSWIEGGSGTESASKEMPIYLPEGYEAGTLGTPAICALSGGIDYVRSFGIDRIEERLSYLTERLAERLFELDDITVLSYGNGIVLFNYKDFPSSKTAAILDEVGIFVRSGLHCAPSAHKKLGTDYRGAIRASLSVLNTEREIDKLYKTLKEMSVFY